MNVCFHKERRQTQRLGYGFVLGQHSVPAQHRLGTCRCTHCDAFATRSNTSLLIHVPIIMYSRSAKGLSIDSHHHSHLVRRSLWGSFSMVPDPLWLFFMSLSLGDDFFFQLDSYFYRLKYVRRGRTWDGVRFNGQERTLRSRTLSNVCRQ